MEAVNTFHHKIWTAERISAKFLPCVLMDEQLENWLQACHDLHQVQDEPYFLSKVITGNETYVYW
jgi:hypothetical protein